MQNTSYIAIAGAFTLALMTSFNNITRNVPSELNKHSANENLQNSAPVVKIISPEANTAFSRNAMVTYSVNVSDKEDGESKYQEIAANEVFMEVKYFDDDIKAKAYVQKGIQKDSPGFSVMRNADCFNCHNIKSKLIGPSFEEISKRYPNSVISIQMLAGRIKKGSTGVWGPAAMPSHPDVSESDAVNMAGWILKNGGDPDLTYYRGLQGAFWCKPVATTTKGVYVVTASYLDHGIDGDPKSALKGQDMIILKEKK